MTSILGWRVSAAGDINADGYDDFLVTSDRFVHAYLGSVSGPGAVPFWSVQQEPGGSDFGETLAEVGDVNADGYDDILIGDYRYGNDVNGRAYLYLGGAGGFSANADQILDGEAEDYLGWAIGGAGDVNADGYDDVVIGFPFFSNDLFNEGKVAVYFGSEFGLEDSPGSVAEGNAYYAWVGFSVAGAGDVNGDGYDDVIAGGFFPHGVQVYLGSSSGIEPSPVWARPGELTAAVSSAGDTNADGYDDVMVMDGVAGRVSVFLGRAHGIVSSPAWSKVYSSPGCYGFCVAEIPIDGGFDVNADGYDDMIVGDFWPQQAWVHTGSSTGPKVDAAWTKVGGGDFGFAASGAGDVNGDGFDDILVGAPHASNGEHSEGIVYLYYGGNTTTTTTTTVAPTTTTTTTASVPATSTTTTTTTMASASDDDTNDAAAANDPDNTDDDDADDNDDDGGFAC
ncbi:integrin alpha [bacterium]|nr:integrin alpha [bacterium]